MTQTTPARPMDGARLLLWTGLLTGLVEGAILTFRRFVQHQSVWAPADVLWMAPLVYLTAAIPLAVAAALAIRLAPRLCSWARLAGVAGFLGAAVLSALLFGGLLHWSAHLLLAVGIGLQYSRRVAPPALAGRRLPWLVAAVLLVAVGFVAGNRLRERRAVRGAASGRGPNVLLIIWDTVRAESLSLYGYARPTTPETLRRAASGVTFEQAMSTAPWTLGSHAGMFTGLYTQDLSVGWRTPLRTSAPTLAGELASRGYRTGGFVANLVAASRESGLARGFGRYEDFPFTVGTAVRSTLLGQRLDRWRPFFRGGMRIYEPLRAAAITDNFLAWEGRGEGPWFAFLNYFDAHDPYYPPPGYRARFNGPVKLIDKYDGAIALLDQELARLLDTLAARGVLDSTIVILTSDHGELFGEHGLHQHGNSLYSQVLHVPLVIWAPGRVPAGRRIPREVSLRDLPATVFDLAYPGEPHPFPGATLARAWRDSATPPDTILAGVPKGVNTPATEPVTRGNMSAVLSGGLHYIVNGDGALELFDRRADPSETHDLAAEPARRGTIDTLHDALRARIPATWHADTARGRRP
ncbi:MAG: sulfatase-like hydrolase/transferase [Gemmatimonadetes bacterium]|nr:sulfatase-like hydrolase/transferase [Gemmatimonadota bacterium]MBK7784291.1 sulfatase-like hydrolase/transferase [Gemmatimonadota bacterium]MBK9067665.1 sulfatase-like hydrolase/transferase [Gemmatimonadota bacterium]